jgi:hypothetical protein
MILVGLKTVSVWILTASGLQMSAVTPSLISVNKLVSVFASFDFFALKHVSIPEQ